MSKHGNKPGQGVTKAVQELPAHPARRELLRAGLSLGLLAGTVKLPAQAAAAHSDPHWMRRPGAPFSNYGVPSAHERDTIRWVSANAGVPGNGVSWCPLHQLEGILTPNGLHYERHHNGVPQIDPARHELFVHGQVRRPLSFRVHDLLHYPLHARICFVECGGNSNAGWNRQPAQTAAGYMHGLVSCSEWTGVSLATVLQEAGPEPDASWLIAEGADAFAMNVSIPLPAALRDGLLALYQNGERLRPENGYPLRLILPGREGVLNVKWLRRLYLSTDPIMARNETSKYTELQDSGQARQFTQLMEVKSLLTYPSSGMRLPGPGLYQLSGLAWSGRGRIRGVEITTDGGDSWQQATLQEPVLAQCFTRFRLPWRWDGRRTLLGSQATDERGARQPHREELLAERSRHSYFHYNATVFWEIEEDGTVRHAYRDTRRNEPVDGAADIDAGWF